MMKKKKLIYGVSMGMLSLIQLIGIMGVVVLNYLSRRKVGLNHHVIIEKKEYMKTILSTEAIEVYKICTLVLIALAIIYLIWCIMKKRNKWMIVSSVIVLIFSILLYVEFISAVFISLPIYAYILLVTVIILVIELLKIGLQFLFFKKKYR